MKFVETLGMKVKEGTQQMTNNGAVVTFKKLDEGLT